MMIADDDEDDRAPLLDIFELLANPAFIDTSDDEDYEY